MMEAEPQILARLTSQPYLELLDAMRARLDELGMPHTRFDAICGVAEGYSNKVLSNGNRKPVGAATMLVMLEAMGLEVWLVHNEAWTAKLKTRSDWAVDRWPKAKREKHNRAVTPAMMAKLLPHAWKAFAAHGARAMHAKRTGTLRSEIARKIGRKGGIASGKARRAKHETAQG